MSIVIDASLALAWLFERQSTEDIQQAERVLSALAHSKIWVPAMWHQQVTHALLQAENEGLITPAQSIDYLSRLSELPIITDESDPAPRRDRIMALARSYRLSVYLATYLELALRRNATLASFEPSLILAMKDAGGTLFGR